MITREQELALIRQYQHGTKRERDDAFNELSKAHEAFLYQEALTLIGQTSARRRPQARQLMPYGQEGLFIALERFRPELGHRLLTYASAYIRKHMQEGLVELGAWNTLDPQANNVIRARQTLQQQGYYPTNKEIADWLGEHGKTVSPARVARTRWSPLSLDELLKRERFEEERLAHEDTPETILQRKEDENYLRATFLDITARLPDWVRPALLYRWGALDGEEHSLEAAGKPFGRTREAVRIYERRVKKKILSKYAGRNRRNQYALRRS